jgi:hypothetical protein
MKRRWNPPGHHKGRNDPYPLSPEEKLKKSRERIRNYRKKNPIFVALGKLTSRSPNANWRRDFKNAKNTVVDQSVKGPRDEAAGSGKEKLQGAHLKKGT